MDIQVFHRYNALVRRGAAKPLTCNSCDYTYVLRATEDGEPVLQCFSCGALVQPGLNMYTDIKSVVKEFFD